MSVPGRLHLITDPRPGRNTLEVVRATLRAGADAADRSHPASMPTVQVRVEDEMTDREAYHLASRVIELCREAGALCLVNDRLDVALAVGADGGHVGDDDLPVAAARRILGPAAVLGATARRPGAARERAAEGAGYLGVGPAYRSPTKDGIGEPIGPSGVSAVVSAVDIPVIAIGGVTADRVAPLTAAGAYGVAVIGGIHSAADPYSAALEFLKALAGPPAVGAEPGPGWSGPGQSAPPRGSS